MRRYSNQKTKWGRFLTRRRGGIAMELALGFFIKLYQYPAIRTAITSLYKIKKPKKWIFIIGSYNSGTTILRDLLEAHPNISSLPIEGVRLTNAFPDLEAGGWPRMMYHRFDKWGDTANISATKAIRDWNPFWKNATTAYLEKSIDHATRITWLNQNFPNAYFISITRNGLAVSEGILRRSKPHGPACKHLGQMEYPCEMVADQWMAFDDTITQGLAKIPRNHSIRYEDLMSDPTATLRGVFNFLELDLPKVEQSDFITIINDKTFELIDQNDTAISRLNPDQLKQLKSRMYPALSKYGYIGGR